MFVRDAGEGNRDVRIGVVAADVGGFLQARSTPEGPEVYRLVQRREGSRLLAYSYEFAGWFDRVSRRGQLALARRGSEEVHRSVENFLRVVSSHLFPEEGGLLLHGAGIVRAGRAHVFFGPSGAGKTTVTLLSEGALVLSDDLVLIRRGAGGCEASAVPFRGLYREPPETDGAFPMAALYRLAQAKEDALERLPGPRAVMEVAASLPFVLEEGGESGRVLETVGSVVRSVPVYRLRFRKSADFWKRIEEEGIA
jgi:hypothetical protein